MTRLAILIALPLIGACGVQSHESNEGGADVSLRTDDSGRVSFNLSVAQSQVKIPGMKMRGDSFDIDGVKLMPGSSVTGFSIDAHDKGSTVNIGFTSPATPEQVRAYFLDQFRRKGIGASLSGGAVAGTSKHGDPFTIRVDPVQGGSKGTIVVRADD